MTSLAIRIHESNLSAKVRLHQPAQPSETGAPISILQPGFCDTTPESTRLSPPDGHLEGVRSSDRRSQARQTIVRLRRRGRSWRTRCAPAT